MGGIPSKVAEFPPLHNWWRRKLQDPVLNNWRYLAADDILGKHYDHEENPGLHKQITGFLRCAPSIDLVGHDVTYHNVTYPRIRRIGIRSLAISFRS